MASPMIDIVGGPLDGKKIQKPKAPTVIVPITVPGEPGFCQFIYTLRRVKDAKGNVLYVLAPAGRDVDRKWLAANKLTN